MEAVDITKDRTIIEVEEDVIPNFKEIGEVDVEAGVTVIDHITAGHMECESTHALTAGPL